MKSSFNWGIAIVCTIVVMAGFQNCAPVSFNPTDAINASSQANVAGVSEKSCDLEKKKEGETWMSAAGQDRELFVCAVGVGNQFKVYDVQKEYICTNGTATLTGKVVKSPAGVEGLCNVDCGSHKNGELWFMDMGTSNETLQCPTTVAVTSTVKYQNLAEYKCVNAIASATGLTKKNKISETACPALTFNDTDNQATLAFEDVYPTPLDSDYNDFVTNIKVTETYSSLGELNQIVIEYKAKHLGGSLLHKLITVFDGTVRGRDSWVSNQNIFKSEPMFNGNANIKFDLYDGNGTLLSSTTSVPKDRDLIVFDNSHVAVDRKMIGKITITNIDGKQNLLADRKGLSIKRYRTLLYVPNASGYSKVDRYDIDISDINPSAYDESGRPLAFFVPINWRSPKEGTDIKYPYPDFKAHADYLKNSILNPTLIESDAAKNWFNNVVLSFVD